MIGGDDSVYENTGEPNSWINLGGYAKEISASMNGVVYAIGGDNAVYENHGAGWVSLGGYVKQISASVTSASSGGSFVIAIGLNDGLWSNYGSGWVSLGNYVTEVSAPAAGNFGISLPGAQTYIVGKGHAAFLHKGTSFVSIAGGSIE
jgi:hypothetical protein